MRDHNRERKLEREKIRVVLRHDTCNFRNDYNKIDHLFTHSQFIVARYTVKYTISPKIPVYQGHILLLSSVQSPVFTLTQEDLIIEEGEVVELRVLAEASPDPTYR